MPVIQLSFDNPLNTSVQVGDNAYFSNPTPVSTEGNPLGGQWTSTTTPHMTNDIADVVDLGEILTITPWNGTNSFITCDMDQVLFNKYFSRIVAGGCVIDTTNLTGSGDCATIQPVFDAVAGDLYNCVGQFPGQVYGPGNPCTSTSGVSIIFSMLEWYFNNPTEHIGYHMFHFLQSTSWGGFYGGTHNGSPRSPYNHPYCEVQPGVKAVPPSIFYPAQLGLIDDFSSDPTVVNLWVQSTAFKLQPPSLTSPGPAAIYFGRPTSSQTVNKIINYLNSNYPTFTGFTLGMTWTDFQNYAYTVNASISNAGGESVEGSLSGTEVCSPGSYIMFSKDNKANMSSILGYYASVEYRNSSQVKSELFNVGTDFFESSK